VPETENELIPKNIYNYLRAAGYKNVKSWDLHYVAIAIGSMLKEQYLIRLGIDFTGMTDCGPLLPKLSKALDQQKGFVIRSNNAGRQYRGSRKLYGRYGKTRFNPW